MLTVYRNTATTPLPSGEDCQCLDIADLLAAYFGLEFGRSFGKAKDR